MSIGRGSALSRRRFLVSGSVLGTAAAIAACAATPASQPAGEPVGAGTPAVEGQPPAQEAEGAVLRMMYFHGQWEAAFQDIINTFQEQNSNIQVIFEAAPTNYQQKLQVGLAGGAAPDLFSVNWLMTGIFGRSNLLYSLQPEIDADEQFASDIEACVPVSVQKMQFQDEQVAVPFDFDTIALIYNVSMFQEAGIEEPKGDVDEDWDWAAMLEIAQSLTEGEGLEKKYGYFSTDTGGQRNWWHYIWANGGTILNENSTRCTVNNEEAIQAVQFLTDCKLVQGVSPSSEIMAGWGTTWAPTMFMTGKVAMVTDGSWRLSQFTDQVTDFEWNIAHLPKSPNTGNRQSVLHSTGLAIPRSSRHTKAAALLARHMVTSESMTRIGQIGATIPARVDAADYFFELPPDNRAVYKQAVDYAHAHIQMSQHGIPWTEALKPLNDHIGQIFEGKETPAEGLAMAESEVNDLLEARGISA